MNLHLQEKRIIVTGGAKGIGRGIVQVLAEEGAYVLIIDKDQEATQKTIEELKAWGYQADAAHADLTDPEQCKRAVSTLLQNHG